MPFYTYINVLLYAYMCTDIQSAAQTHTDKFYLLLFCTHFFHSPCFLLTSFVIIVSFIRIHSFKHLLLRLPPLLLFSLLHSHHKRYDFITFAHSFCVTCSFTHSLLAQLLCSFCYVFSFRVCVCVCCACMPVCVRVNRNVNASETHVWSRLIQSGHFFAFIPKQVVRF